MLSRFFLNNSNKKMLAPRAVDIAVIISSLIAYYVSHFPNHSRSMTFFSSSSQVVHWSAEIQTKVYEPRKARPTDRLTKQVNSRSLTELLFFILQNSRRNGYWCIAVTLWQTSILSTSRGDICTSRKWDKLWQCEPLDLMHTVLYPTFKCH